jgi:hypothetical protein
MRLRAVLRLPSLELRAIAAAGLLLTGAAAGAGDSTSYEFWPEINAYKHLDERSRLLFTAAATHAMEGAVEDSKASFQDLQFTANYDYTLAPVLRRDVPTAEWSKNRLLWARMGFAYGSSTSGSENSFKSYTGIVELNSRYPAGDAWLTSRLRVDFRHINGEPSQRYRVRVGAEWETVAFEHRVAPYGDVEVLYDTRYEQWSRTTLKTGFETPIGDRWRVEPYLAWQLNRPAETLSHVLGLGLTFKYYIP